MDEPKRLRDMPINELATEMAGVQEGAVAWSKYVAEFQRRSFVQQRFSSLVAVGSVVVSAIAIVVGAIVSVRTDLVVSQDALDRASQSCRLPTLPTNRTPTNGDLAEAYMQRGEAILECDRSRQTAVEIIQTVPHTAR